MVSSEIKSIVAENCPKFRVKEELFIHNYSFLNNKCDMCTEFINGKCKSGFLDNLWNDIRFN